MTRGDDAGYDRKKRSRFPPPGKVWKKLPPAPVGAAQEAPPTFFFLHLNNMYTHPRRWNADIYSEPVMLARKMKVVQTNKTKATYTVSRIIQKAKDETEKAEQAAAQAAEISSSSDSE